MWQLYIFRCADDSFYTGITTDLERRLKEHNSSPLGSKYTRARRPVSIVYSRQFEDKSGASKEEYRIKKLSRQEKIAIFEGTE